MTCFQFENISPQHQRDPQQVDCQLYLPVELVVVDRQKEEAHKIQYHVETPEGMTESWNTGDSFEPVMGSEPGEFVSDHQPGEFEKKVQTIREGCREEFFEVVLSQSFSKAFREGLLCSAEYAIRISPYTSDQPWKRTTGGRFSDIASESPTTVGNQPHFGTVPGEDPMETADRIKSLISSEKRSRTDHVHQ